MLGWKIHNISNTVKHFRQAAADYSSMSLPNRFGKSNYTSGYTFFIAMARFAVKMKDKPYCITRTALFVV